MVNLLYVSKNTHEIFLNAKRKKTPNFRTKSRERVHSITEREIYAGPKWELEVANAQEKVDGEVSASIEFSPDIAATSQGTEVGDMDLAPCRSREQVKTLWSDVGLFLAGGL